MKFIIENIANYKKLVNAICSIPSVRKQLNGIEQCIEIKTDGDNNRITLTTVDLTSHSVKLHIQAQVVEEGRQLVLASKLKSLSSKLSPKHVLEVCNRNNMLNYEAKPFGSIAEHQYFSQDSIISSELTHEVKWSDVSPTLGFFIDLIPLACSNTYQDREIYITSNMSYLNMYVRFSETSYIRYKVNTETNATINGFRAAVRPPLLRLVQLLRDEEEEDIILQYCPTKQLIKFNSMLGEIVVKCDMKPNKLATKIDHIVDEEFDAEIQITHEDITDSLNFQSYNTTDTDVVSLDYNLEEDTFLISTSDLFKPTMLKVNHSGLFDKTSLSVGHLTKALKAMGSPKNKVLPVDVVKIQVKSQSVKNANPIKIIHLTPEVELDVTSDVIMYEVIC